MKALHRDDPSRLSAVQRVRRTTLLAILVFGISMAATGWAWRANRMAARDRARTHLQQQIDRTRANLRTRLVVYEDALYGTRSLFEASQGVTRAEFREYVTNLKLGERYPGIQGIGYAERIRPQELAQHTARIRTEGFPDYRVHPAGERQEYTSIIYLEPFNWRNQRAFSYDMFSEPTRHEAMCRARDSGAIAVTSKVTLVQETTQNVQAGFLMYLPRYRRDLPQNTPAERRAALLGYIYSPFRMGDLLSEFPRENPELAHFEMFSGHNTNSDSLMYRDPGLDHLPAGYKPALTQMTEVDFGGQSWTLRFSTTPDFDALLHEYQSGSLLPAGIAISVLLSGIILLLARTEQRAVQLADIITARLRESEAHVRAITETATDGIISADVSGRIVYFNPAAERIFGYKAEEILNSTLLTLLPEEFQREHGRVFERYLRSHRSLISGRTLEITGKRANGAEFPLSVSMSGWKAGELFFTGIVRDITERKLAETNIMKLNQELTDALFRSEKLAITGRLMATIAHEINNPLAALTNLLFVLDSESLSPAAKEYVRMAQDQVAMLTNISQQTLTPYREGHFPAVTNISELLDDVLSMLRPKLLSAKVHVVRRYPALVEVKLYPSELRQVFTNLVANAIDAMPDGGQLTVTVTSAEDNISISVADTGSGIPAEYQDKLFEPFFTTKGEHGTGVGLWVVKEIINRLGGKIELATSRAPQNHGTTFTVSLPASEGVQEPEPEEPTQLQSAYGKSSGSE